MKNRLALLVALAIAALPAALLAATWTNAPLVDRNCSERVRDDPDSHPRSCALECKDSGYGILSAEGEFLPFDAEGSKIALAALEASEREDHLRVDVSGTLADGVLTVESLKLVE